MAEESKSADPCVLKLLQIISDLNLDNEELRSINDSFGKFLDIAIYGTDKDSFSISQEEFDKEIMTRYIDIIDFILIYLKGT